MAKNKNFYQLGADGAICILTEKIVQTIYIFNRSK